MKKIYTFIVVAIFAVCGYAQQTTVIYNGEDVNPQWEALESTPQNNVPNPVKAGINTSDHCAAIERVSGGAWHQGAALWGDNTLHLKATEYNRMSIMILKEIAGHVTLEIQGDRWENEFLAGVYTTPGQWQKLTFSLYRGQEIQRILVEIHTEEPAGFSTQTMYWDNLEVWYEAPVAATASLILWDGDNVFDNEWTPFELTPNNGTANPDKTGINTSDFCASVTWGEGKPEHCGGWFNQDNRAAKPIFIDPLVYNKLSLMVKKPTNGIVQMHLIMHGFEDMHVPVEYTGGGEWQNLVFDLSCLPHPFHSIALSIHQQDGGLQANEIAYWDNLVAYYEPTWFDELIPENKELVIYDGEEVTPEFYNVSATVVNDTVNPVTDGINPSLTCASIFRNGTDETEEGGKLWSGGLLKNCSHVYINPAEYPQFSLMVLKNDTGTVALEVQQGGEINGYLIKAKYTTPGQWQKLIFDIPADQKGYINNILVQIHRENAGTFESQTMYWDNLTAIRSKATAIATTPKIKDTEKGRIIDTRYYNIIGQPIRVTDENNIHRGTLLLKVETDVNGNRFTTKIVR